MIAAICVGAAVFVAVWTLGELLWVQRRPDPRPPVTFVQDRCRDLSCTCNLEPTP